MRVSQRRDRRPRSEQAPVSARWEAMRGVVAGNPWWAGAGRLRWHVLHLEVLARHIHGRLKGGSQARAAHGEGKAAKQHRGGSRCGHGATRKAAWNVPISRPAHQPSGSLQAVTGLASPRAQFIAMAMSDPGSANLCVASVCPEQKGQSVSAQRSQQLQLQAAVTAFCVWMCVVLLTATMGGK